MGPVGGGVWLTSAAIRMLMNVWKSATILAFVWPSAGHGGIADAPMNCAVKSAMNFVRTGFGAALRVWRIS